MISNKFVPTPFRPALFRAALAAALLAAATVPAACNSTPRMPITSSNAGLVRLMQNNSVSVSLSGLMTMDDHGQNVTAYKQFGVQNVPITWSNTTFEGNITSNITPHQQSTDNVHGIATTDGKFLEHITFWRLITEDGQPDITIDITIYAIPMDGVDNSTLDAAFIQTGDIQKHVLGITYEADGVSYVRTDWGNTSQPPAVNIQFSR